MKAIVYREYGSSDVLKIEEIDKPIPKDDEVLIKVQAASVNAADWHLMRGDPFPMRLLFGFFKPKNNLLGADVAGVVEAVGKNVKQFNVGDAVFGDISSCGFGAFAEYVCASETVLALKPQNTSFEEAAATPMAAVTALQGLRDKGDIQPGKKVLINGASGGVGTFAVQIAKLLGADVTGVCSTKNVEMVQTLGADHVIDYTKDDFASNGQRYDLVHAVNGNRSIFDYKRALSATGIYVTSGGAGTQMLQAMLIGPWLFLAGRQKMKILMAMPNQNDLTFIKELLEAGKIKPVIHRRYSFNEVPEAIRYVEEGHASGKAVINFGS